MTAELGSALAAPAPGALHLLDGPYAVVDGARRELPEGSKRLVVFVALAGGRVDRRAAAGLLWPDGGDVRAAGNLRSALWRMRGAGVDLIDGDKTALWLRAGIAVDLRRVSDWAGRLIEGAARIPDLDPALWCPQACHLLPGWYDEWVVFERERLRQRVLHGMEALGRLLVRARRPHDAVTAARRVVAVDPLRESAQRVLVEAPFAAGDVDGALSSYATYRAAVLRLLGAPPSAAFTALVHAPAASHRSGGALAARWAARTAGARIPAPGCTDRNRMPGVREVPVHESPIRRQP
jgi:DNA-binding SARP family transcriptional activator